ncbi:MAG: hypothetical protein M3081_21660 [Gemmatimonadota bacterium]|nr:hypothetical protein [Gemmatimonadota bacterium]
MTTKLSGILKREIEMDGEPFVVAISEDGVTITPKGKRKGMQMSWRSIWTGDAELVHQLRVSVEATGKQ